MPTPADLPLPSIDLDNKGFWDAACRQELTYGRCRICSKAFFYPRNFCPFCLAEEAELVTASGKGEIYSVSVVRRVERPYALAYVRLAEGPTLFTNIVACDLDRLKIGQAVEVVFVPSQGGPLVPMFRPVT